MKNPQITIADQIRASAATNLKPFGQAMVAAARKLEQQ